MVRTSLLDAGVRDKAKLASTVFHVEAAFFLHLQLVLWLRIFTSCWPQILELSGSTGVRGKMSTKTQEVFFFSRPLLKSKPLSGFGLLKQADLIELFS